MTSILILCFLLNPFSAYSQRNCGYDEHLKVLTNDTDISNRIDQIEREIKSYLKNNKEQRSEEIKVFKIPVVVHIVLPNPNDVTNEQVYSQIQVLNEDFNALNSDITNVPSVFQNLISDTNFEFFLAHVGPDCNGITRTVTDSICFYNPRNIRKTVYGGRDAIDTKHILNIWVGNSCTGALGYGTHPGVPPEIDGVFIAYNAFGKIGNLQPHYDLGRTATHEIGHYFDLIHIWGPGYESCTDSDEVDDTPNQLIWNGSCQDFPHISCNNGPNGDLFMNFLDSGYDDCVIMFTKGQSERMQATLKTVRKGLLEDYVGEINIVSIITKNPTCLLNNGNATAIVGGCAHPPFSYKWSNGKTTQTIENLAPGTYSVTVSNSVGHSAVATTEIFPEIIVNSTNNTILWSDIVNQYQLPQNQLTNRNLYIDKDLLIDMNYTFLNVSFSFTEGKSMIIKNGISVDIKDNYGDRVLLHSCGTYWNGLIVQENAILKLQNADILDVITGISATKCKLDLQDIQINGHTGKNGIEMIGDVNCYGANLNINNFKTGIWSIANSKMPEFRYGKINYCEKGFFMLATPIIIDFYETIISVKSIVLSGCSGSIITNCELNSSGKIGIEAYNSSNLTIYNNNYHLLNYNLEIFANLIRCPKSILELNNSLTTQYGIKLTESNLTKINGNYFNVFGNTFSIGGGIQLNRSLNCLIENNAIYTNQCNFGIEVNNSNDVTISDNYEINHTSNTPEFTAAIKTLGSNFQKIERNLVNTSGNVTGILAKNSPGNIYSCNYLTGPKEGLLIDYNSTFHDIKGNKFFDCAYDLKTRSVLGPQYFKGNEFYNGNCLAEGLTVDQIENSKFFVNQNIPHHMPSNPIPGNEQWFKHQDVTEYFKDCPEDPRGGRTGFDDERVLNDYFDDLKLERSVSPERYFVNMMHLLEYDHARDDYSLPRYIKDDPVWLELDEWTELAEAINSLSDVAELSGQSALTQNDLDNLSTLQKSYVEADDEAAREVIYSQLSALMARLSPAFDQERTIDSLEMDQLKNQFRSLSGRNDQMVMRWADIYSMYIDFLQKGEVVESNKAALLAYSRECADKYGDAIHMARTMANTFDNTYFDVYDDCPEDIQPRTGSRTLNAIVNPNPTSGEFTIHFDTFVSGTIEIIDITGKSIRKERVKDAIEHRLKLNVKNGIYLLNVISENGEIFVEKIVVYK